ncbi:glycosyltransferase family 4 protein [Paenibacillus thalictri]|uniref:Glycosyltransferase WbuB n=1 Tax=Paenibacillus thalictri TaxID=2527873 RepID=A0A4V2J3A8_9BACL|nr:glycosyltransferase family 4 protein [Paenibacillus thalictri]TBL70842.1 glycosyltransferase WbuB [Paenibacillus thalictri]
MNILLINHYAGSVKHGMEYRPYYMARKWTELGHKVTIVAASHSHLRTQAPRLDGPITREVVDGITYIWLKTPGYEGNGAKRVLNMFAFVSKLLQYGSRLSSQLKPHVVIASSTYPLDVIPAKKIADKAGAKLMFEVHDLWPLTPIELGGISPKHPFMMLLQWAENYAYRVSDKVVSMLPKADSHMVAHGMLPDKFSYVPNGINTEEWDAAEKIPEDHNTMLKQLRADGNFIIGYVGSHGLANALDYFIQAAPLLRTLPVKLVMVGKGPDKAKLQELAEKLGADNVIFLPPVPKKSVPQLLSRMDALYIGFKRTALYRFGVSPNKLMDYMMAGKPIINALEAGNDPVKESGGGISIPPEDPAAIERAVRQLLDLSEYERRKLGQQAKKYVLQRHDYNVLAKKFADLMG